MKLPLLNILRTSKVFAVVLGLHLFVLSLLLFHPGCQHTPTEAPSAPMSEVSSLDNATLATPTRPEGSTSSSVNTGTPINDAAAATSTTIQPSVTSEVTAPMAAENTYSVQKGDSLWSIAHSNHVSVTALLDANNLTRNSVLKVGQTLKIPASSSPAVSSASASASSASDSVPATGGTYVVKAGDSLGKIAKMNGVSVRALKSANKIHSNTIRVGQKLKIPSGKAAAMSDEKSEEKPVAKKSEKAAPAASSTTDSASTTSTDSSSTSTSSDGYTTHKVGSGESPAIIAHKYGMKTSELIALNHITDPHKLKVGQELKVKAPADTSTTSTTTTTTTTTSGSTNSGMSVQALEAATSTNTEAAAPVVEVKSDATPASSTPSDSKPAATESK